MRIQDTLREFRQEIEKLYGPRLKGVILHGSWAKGDETREQRAPKNWELWMRLMIGRRLGAPYGSLWGHSPIYSYSNVIA